MSLEVRAGEVVTIIGANGAGKSTLLKSIVGLEPVAEGRVLVDGKDCTHVPAHQRVGLGVALSPEGRGVFPDQTVRENLMLGAYSRRNDKAFVERAIEREFARFPRLKERAHQLSGTLSGGEQQMLAIARALMSEPRLLLLDEPSLGLAPLIIKDIFDAIRQLRSSGLTILLVEQMAKQGAGRGRPRLRARNRLHHARRLRPRAARQPQGEVRVPRHALNSPLTSKELP